jgi:hypothetical protein
MDSPLLSLGWSSMEWLFGFEFGFGFGFGFCLSITSTIAYQLPYECEWLVGQPSCESDYIPLLCVRKGSSSTDLYYASLTV